jgi:putative membrane protein
MYVKRIIDPKIIFYFSWKPILYSTLLSAGVLASYEINHWHAASIPFLPIATVGTAVAFYVGFKNNSSYDRLWEARKIWGEITNTSRAICAYFNAVLRNDSDKSKVRDFVYRHIAYINMLRIQLRSRNMWGDSNIYTQLARECLPQKPFDKERDEILADFCAHDDLELLRSKRNIAKEILSKQMQVLTGYKANGSLDTFEHTDLMRMCAELYGSQGKAERIKTFPFPRQYAFFSEVFVAIFVTLLPFGLIGEFAKLGPEYAWLTIPFTVLIAFVFFTMERVGDTSENPFEGSLNDVPMSAICRNIEIDLRELLNETELPKPLEAVDHILM